MARQTFLFEIGPDRVVADPTSELDIRWRNRLGPLSNTRIDRSLLQSDEVAYIGRIQINTEYNSVLNDGPQENACLYRFNTISTPQEGEERLNDPGPQMSAAWENSLVSITLAAGEISITIPGPNSLNFVNRDEEEPYIWRCVSERTTPINTFIPSQPDNARQLIDEVRAFILAWDALPDADKAATTLTLDDGINPTLVPNTPLSVPENSPVGTTLGVAATAQNFADGTPAWRFANGTTTSFLFDINPSTGVISLNASPNFEALSQNNQDNGFTRSIVLEQGGDTATVNVQIFVTDVQEIRLSSQFNGVVSVSTSLTVVEPDSVRLSSSFNGVVSVSSTLAITEPSDVRLSSSFNGVVSASSSLTITEQNAVRLSSSFNGVVSASTTLTVIEPDSVRLSSSFSGVVSVSSTLNIADATSVRLASSFNGVVTVSSTLNITEPTSVRLSSTFNGVVTAQVTLSIPIQSVRVSSTFHGVIDVSVILDTGPRAQRKREERIRARSLGGSQELYALEITNHQLVRMAERNPDADIQPVIRVISDTQEHRIEDDPNNETEDERVHSYIALPFSAEIPQDKNGERRTAVLTVDNVGQELMQWIDQSQGGKNTDMRIMRTFPPRGDEPLVVSWEVTLSVSVAEITNENVTISLTNENIFGAPAVQLRHDTLSSPGLF